jgi:hypothetical protein
MGWLVSALLALLLLSLLAIAVPTLFGPPVAGIAPILVVVALIGLGGVWWRRSRHRVDAETTDDAGAGPTEDGLHGEDDRVET